VDRWPADEVLDQAGAQLKHIESNEFASSLARLLHIIKCHDQSLTDLLGQQQQNLTR